jgi:hypothetical protein
MGITIEIPVLSYRPTFHETFENMQGLTLTCFGYLSFRQGGVWNCCCIVFDAKGHFTK